MSELLRTGIDKVHKNVVHRYLTSGDASNDREIAHERAIRLMEFAQENPALMVLMHKMFTYSDPILQTEVAGIAVPNPLGIAAGFDKNARVHRVLGEGLGFGLVTVGSVTKKPYEGNQRPRIFDL